MNNELINLVKEIGLSPTMIFILILIIMIEKAFTFFKYFDDFKSRKLQILDKAINYNKMPSLEKKRLYDLKVQELY